MTTQPPASSAGRTTRATSSARAAANRVASATGVSAPGSPESRISRTRSPRGVPPGSRVAVTAQPARLEGLGQQPRLGALAAAVDPLQGDEAARAQSPTRTAATATPAISARQMAHPAQRARRAGLRRRSRTSAWCARPGVHAGAVLFVWGGHRLTLGSLSPAISSAMLTTASVVTDIGRKVAA